MQGVYHGRIIIDGHKFEVCPTKFLGMTLQNKLIEQHTTIKSVVSLKALLSISQIDK